MKRLHKELLKLSKSKSRRIDLIVETSDFVNKALLGTDETALKVYFLLTLAGLGKSRYPMCKYDPKLTNELNSKNFFPTQIGGKFESQRSKVLSKLTKGMTSGLIFVERYSFEQTAWVPHLWSIGVAIETVDGDKTLHFNATFGHCKLYPLLQYEIAGVTAIIRWFEHMTGIHNVTCQWSFASISNASKRNFSQFDSFAKLPEPGAIAEFIRYEEVIRNAKGALSKPPLMRYPLSDEMEAFADVIHRRWHGSE